MTRMPPRGGPTLAVVGRADLRGGIRAARSALGLLAVLVVSEVLVVAGQVLLAEVCLAVVLVVGVSAGGAWTARSSTSASAMHALALVACARVIAIAFPLTAWERAAALLTIALLVGMGTAWMTARLDLPTARRWSTSQARRDHAAAAVVGTTLGIGASLTGALDATTASLRATSLLVAAFAVVSSGIVEELIVRNAVQRTLEGLAPRIGLVAAAVLGAALYAGFRSWSLVLIMLTAGLAFGWRVSTHGRIGPAITGRLALVAGTYLVGPALPGPPVPSTVAWLAPWLVIAAALARHELTSRPSAPALPGVAAATPERAPGPAPTDSAAPVERHSSDPEPVPSTSPAPASGVRLELAPDEEPPEDHGPAFTPAPTPGDASPDPDADVGGADPKEPRTDGPTPTAPTKPKGKTNKNQKKKKSSSSKSAARQKQRSRHQRSAKRKRRSKRR